VRVCRTAARRATPPGGTRRARPVRYSPIGVGLSASRDGKNPPARQAQAVSIAAFGTTGISTPQCELDHICRRPNRAIYRCVALDGANGTKVRHELPRGIGWLPAAPDRGSRDKPRASAFNRAGCRQAAGRLRRRPWPRSGRRDGAKACHYCVTA
jgi:hypothetical protein